MSDKKSRFLPVIPLGLLALFGLLGVGACGGGAEDEEAARKAALLYAEPDTITRTIDFTITSSHTGTSVFVRTPMGVLSFNEVTATDADLVNSPTSSVAFVEDANGALLFPILLRGSDQTDLNLRVDSHNIAAALVRLTPSVAALSTDAFEAAQEKLAEAENWDLLVSSVEDWLAEPAGTRFSFEANPHIFLGAANVARQIVGQPAQSDVPAPAQTDSPLYEELATLCGNVNLPHLELEFDGGLYAVNPSSNFIAVHYNNELYQLIPPRHSWLESSQWPFSIATGDAERVFVKAPQGESVLGLTNGFGFVAGRAQQVARNANVLRALQIVISTMGPMMGDHSGLAANEAEDIESVERIIELAKAIEGQELSEIGTALASAIADGTSWSDLVGIVAERVANPEVWDIIREVIWPRSMRWGATTESRDNVLRVFAHCAKVFSLTSTLGSAVTASDGGVPFLQDLSRIPVDYTFNLETDGSLISLVRCSTTPMAHFLTERGTFSVGDSVQFDASTSIDSEDALGDLDFRWDFDGDGIFDTIFNNSPTVSHTFDQRGLFPVKLEIRDTDGNRTRYVRTLEMGDATALKVVLIWGEDPADLDSHLFTPVVGGSAYHISFQNKRGAAVPPYSFLDLDAQNGYGPETTWFIQTFPGTYSFYVHKQSGGMEIEDSGAVVKVISRYEVIQRFQAPQGNGDWWHVFDMDGTTQQFTPVNAYSAAP